MNLQRAITAGIFLLPLVTTARGAFADNILTVAAASNTQSALREIADIFEKTRPVKVEIVAGSTGKLYTQIIQGAPFHVFVSADTKSPELLEQKGLLKKGKRFTFTGALVVWTKSKGISIEGKNLDFLKDERIKLIAMANPDTAPYGKAALSALGNAGILASVKDKLVYGENVSQAFNFAASGNADAAMVSIATVYGQGGSYFTVDGRYHPPIIEQAVILRNAPPSASDFLDFLKTGEALKIFRKYGYSVSSVPYHRQTALAWFGGRLSSLEGKSQ
ncbi:MAG: molybdate ABC transporter substrate-binding protein [Deltaproteobacteria bacterium]|nr:molybdate ABC transporter substrate-binding protein [Deltaproteobacteria bacterium]